MMWRFMFVAILAVAVLGDDILNPGQALQIDDALRSQCKKNNAEDKVEDLKNAGKAFVSCVKDLFNVETIQKEIEEAKPNGALDEVFGKYCNKSPQLKTCFHTLTGAVSPCLDATARDSIGSVNNGYDQLVDFICYKDGDRIALFIAEKGPECFKEKSEGLRECGNKLKERLGSIDQAKSLTLQEQCGKLDELTTCIVKSLEGCETPTPANMAESLFKFVRKGSPCNTDKKN